MAEENSNLEEQNRILLDHFHEECDKNKKLQEEVNSFTDIKNRLSEHLKRAMDKNSELCKQLDKAKKDNLDLIARYEKVLNLTEHQASVGCLQLNNDFDSMRIIQGLLTNGYQIEAVAVGEDNSKLTVWLFRPDDND